MMRCGHSPRQVRRRGGPGRRRRRERQFKLRILPAHPTHAKGQQRPRHQRDPSSDSPARWSHAASHRPCHPGRERRCALAYPPHRDTSAHARRSANRVATRLARAPLNGQGRGSPARVGTANGLCQIQRPQPKAFLGRCAFAKTGRLLSDPHTYSRMAWQMSHRTPRTFRGCSSSASRATRNPSADPTRSRSTPRSWRWTSAGTSR